MNTRTLWLLAGVALLLLVGGNLIALPAALPVASAEGVDASGDLAILDDAVTYQGRLTSAEGVPLSGTYTMRFLLYTAASGGTLLWDSGGLSVAVRDGLFEIDLDVDQADFTGQERWLQLRVNGQNLAPRQPIRPAPYALGLRPGAQVRGSASGAASVLSADLTSGTGRALMGSAPATGTAVYAFANNGFGVVGTSQRTYGVWGRSTNGWGGYFESTGGYGVRVDTTGTDHFDHGAYITSQGGYAVYAQSAQNMAVRGEAGDVTGMAQPLGTVGVVGIGANRGMFGSSANGIGVYGISLSTYGIWGQSQSFRGVTGRTNRSDNNYGVFTPDNLYSMNYNLAGAIMQVVRNAGGTPIDPGDVVVFSGIDAPLEPDGPPVVTVARAETAASTAVAGVAYSRFEIAALADDESADDAARLAALEVTPAGPVPPGGYLLVVVQGPARARASAAGGAIQPGALLASGADPGLASVAPEIELAGTQSARPGTVFGKALEPLEKGEGLIYVYVTLQ